jgi:hypothetical protein
MFLVPCCSPSTHAKLFFPGGLLSTYYGIPFSLMFQQITVSSISGKIFISSAAHGLSHGSVIRVLQGSGVFQVGSLWFVLGSNLGSTSFSLSYKLNNNVAGSSVAVTAVNAIVFSHLPVPISPKTIDSCPKIAFGSIFDIHSDLTSIFGLGVRWSGFLRVPTRSQITFSFSLAATSTASILREKLIFYINGNPLISAWHSVTGINGVATFTGVPRAHYSIDIEYGSSFPLSIQCVLFWKWDALIYTQISPLYLFAAEKRSPQYVANVLPSFVVPQQSLAQGFKSIATSGAVAFFTISTFDRFQNPASLSNISELSSA